MVAILRVFLHFIHFWGKVIVDARPHTTVLALVLSSIVLNIKVPQTSTSAPNPSVGSAVRRPVCAGNKSVAFDWVPPDVPEDVVSHMP
jgi:hypothetical protein